MKLKRFSHLTGIESKYIFLFFIISVISCTRDDYKKYYDENGILLLEEKLINKKDSTFYSKIYNKVGFLEQEGTSDKNGIGNGHWKTYYQDGTLKWQGIVKNGKRFISDSIRNNVLTQKALYQIKGNPKSLKRGVEYKIRTYIEGVSPGYYLLLDSNYNELGMHDEDVINGYYNFTPQYTGLYKILIAFVWESDSVVFGKTKALHLNLYIVE